MDCRLYLRASTDEQDATRARDDLEAFAKSHGLKIVGRYSENESGAKLNRPQLFKLLEDANPGDVLLVEQVDRLSRLTTADWKKLRDQISTRQVRVVALDLPTSHRLAEATDDFTGRVLEAVNGMMLDVLAAVARKDYEDRRRRVAQGQVKAKAEGRYRGRPEDSKRNALIASMLSKGLSWSQIQQATGVARGTVAKIAKRTRDAASAGCPATTVN